jgi:glucose/mannose-6-phosphate isomerase
MNHNEIVGWQSPEKVLKSFVVIMLRSSLDHPRICRRMDITGELLRKEGIKVFEIFSVGHSRLAGIFSLIYVGDLVSFYLAILNGTDPAPVDRILYLKKALKQRVKI